MAKLNESLKQWKDVDLFQRQQRKERTKWMDQSRDFRPNEKQTWGQEWSSYIQWHW